MVKEALVVKRETLFKDKYFEGFSPIEQYNYTSVILENFHYYPRGDELEHNNSLKQIIPYVWIINPRTKTTFAYRRANDKKYAEKRLRNKWSCGVGGHIERQDDGDPITKAMMRELMEEVRMEIYPKPRIIGYINGDKGDVEKFHFGLLAIAETSGNVELGDGEIAEGGFKSIDEMEALFARKDVEVEEWTVISWPFVKSCLLKS